MNKQISTITEYFTVKTVAVVTVLVGLLAGGCGGGETTPSPFDTNFRLIVPSTAVVSAPATLDGLVTDAKWADSFRLDLVEGVSPSGMIMEGVTDASNLYLYFEVDETNFSGADIVAIALNPSAGANDKRLLLIYPCPSGVCPADATNITPDIDYFLDTNDDGTWESQVTDGGVTARTSFAGGTLWTVEVAIPRAAPFNFGSNDYFGFYTNIIATSSFATAHEYTWPFDQDSTGGLLIFGTESAVPPESVWGNATLDSSIGNGVRVDGLATNHNTSTISWNEENIFTAVAHNNTLTGGNLVAANDVRASFKWANFGLPSHDTFQRIPTDASPAPGSLTAYQNIQPTDSTTFQFNWTVPVSDQAFYQTNPHWCVKVELESSDVTTVFYRQSMQRNMNFAETNSPFMSTATISPLGLKLPEGDREHDYIITERFYNVDSKLKWSSKLGGIKQFGAQQYRAKVAQEKTSRIRLSVLPPMEALTPFKNITVKPGKPGDSNSYTKISLRAGSLVTLMVDQSKKPSTVRVNSLRTEAVQPAIRALSSDSVTEREAAETRVSSETEAIANPQSSGLLMASWDGFEKTQFTINNTISLKVPKGKTTLSIAPQGKETRASQREVSLRVYTSTLEKYHLLANSSLAHDRDPNGIVNLGANLPIVTYRGDRKTGRTIKIKGKSFDVYESAGAFGYIVKGKAATP